jgi:hypothetical protein
MEQVIKPTHITSWLLSHYKYLAPYLSLAILNGLIILLSFRFTVKGDIHNSVIFGYGLLSIALTFIFTLGLLLMIYITYLFIVIYFKNDLDKNKFFQSYSNGIWLLVISYSIKLAILCTSVTDVKYNGFDYRYTFSNSATGLIFHMEVAGFILFMFWLTYTIKSKTQFGFYKALFITVGPIIFSILLSNLVEKLTVYALNL